MIALTTENPAMPLPFNVLAFSTVIPPIATTGMSIESTISFNSSLETESASSLVAVGKTAPEPI